jgi:hypothetical protein
MEDTLERFRVADATAPDRAQSLESLGLQPNAAVNRLAAAGVIVPGTRAGRFYVSEVALAAYKKRQAGRVRIAAAAGFVVALAALLAALLVVTARR